MDDRDIYRSAKRFLDLFGADALTQAALRTDAMSEATKRGDMEGAAVWERIGRAITEIQTTEGRTKLPTALAASPANYG